MRNIVVILIIISLLAIYISDVLPANLDEAIKLYKKHDFKKCIRYLENYIKTNPDPKAYFLLGYAHYKLRNYNDSVKYFKEAYFIDPEFTPSKISFSKQK